MAVYLVSCALSSSEHDYQALWSFFEVADAVRALETTWLIDAAKSLSEMSEAVRAFMAEGDRVLVVGISPETPWAATHLLEGSSTWLKQRRP